MFLKGDLNYQVFYILNLVGKHLEDNYVPQTSISKRFTVHFRSSFVQRVKSWLTRRVVSPKYFSVYRELIISFNLFFSSPLLSHSAE